MADRLSISRRKFLGGCAAAAGAASVAPHLLLGQSPAVVSRRPPNIIMISTDQWNAEAFSYCGSPWLKTPNVDRIAAAGVNFERSYSTDPVCCPARASWITGRMPSEHRVIGNGFPILESVIDFGQWFSQNGYQTAHFGKWHVPNRAPEDSFQTYYGMNPCGQFADVSVAQMARSFLMGARGNKPFLLHAAFMDPHDICQVACLRAAKGKMPYDSIDNLPTLPENFRAEPTECKTFSEKVRNSWNRSPCWSWDEQDWRLYRWMYFRHCEMVDAAIGQVLDAIEASGQAQNTMVIFTSDHGEGLGHHRLDSKAFLYQESARVPFIVSFPGRVARGENNKDIYVSGIDVFPTICNVAGIAPPPDLCGRDVLAQYHGKEPKRTSLVTSASFGGRMVLDDRYKLITYKDDPTVQLFDMQSDPQETKNIAADKPDVVAQRQATLQEFESKLKPFPLPPGGLAEIWRKYRNKGAAHEGE